MNPEKADFGVGGYRHRLSLSAPLASQAPWREGPGDDGSTAIDEEEGKDASTCIAYLCEHRGGSGSAGVSVTALKPTEWPEQLAFDF